MCPPSQQPPFTLPISCSSLFSRVSQISHSLPVIYHLVLSKPQLRSFPQIANTHHQFSKSFQGP